MRQRRATRVLDAQLPAHVKRSARDYAFGTFSHPASPLHPTSSLLSTTFYPQKPWMWYATRNLCNCLILTSLQFGEDPFGGGGGLFAHFAQYVMFGYPDAQGSPTI